MAALAVGAPARAGAAAPGPDREDAHDRPERAEPAYRTVVRERRGDDRLERSARADARAVGFVDVVDTYRATRARPSDAWTDALREVPGVYVRSYGGLGRFTAISVRGSSAAQVQVLYEGVPVEDSVAGLADLSSLSADFVSSATLHRGYVPVRFGGAALGGVLRLSADRGDRAEARVRLGIGSFGAYELRGSLVRPVGRRGLALAGSAAVAGAEGDFPYLDPGAPHDPFDDRTRIRRNNDYGRISARLALRWRRRGVRAWVEPLAQIRDRGVPGPAGAAWTGARSTERFVWLVSGADLPLPRPGSRVRLRGSVRGILRTFRDPDGTVGLGRNDQVQRTADAFSAAALRIAAWRGAFVEVSADARFEGTRLEDRLAAPGHAPPRRRLRVGTGLELEQSFARGLLLVAAGDRIEALDSHFAAAGDDPLTAAAARNSVRFGHTPRLGVRLRPHRAVRLRASAGRYFRPPTLVELFGDRGYAVGNAALRPESGWNADGGLAFDVPVSGGARLQGTAAGFFTRAEDLIAWVQAGFVTRPENFPGARIAGAEGRLDARFLGGAGDLHAAYTFLHTANLDPDPARHGKPLPGRPAHHATAGLSLAPEVAPDGVRLRPQVGYEVELVAATALDPSGRYVLPARIFHAITFGLTVDERLRLSLAVRNLADRRTAYVRPPVGNVDGPIRVPIADVLGYPLPGRSLWLSVAVVLPRRKERRR